MRAMFLRRVFSLMSMFQHINYTTRDPAIIGTLGPVSRRKYGLVRPNRNGAGKKSLMAACPATGESKSCPVWKTAFLHGQNNMIMKHKFTSHKRQRCVMGFGAAAIAELYANEYARLTRIVSRILNRPDAAEDVIQDTFIKLSGHGIKPSDRGLLVRAVQNMARDYNRGERLRTALPDSIQRTHPEREGISPEHETIAREGLSSLLQAIHSLPRRRAQIFLLAKLDGMSYARIAEELGVSLSTVEKEIAAAMAFCHQWKRDHDFP